MPHHPVHCGAGPRPAAASQAASRVATAILLVAALAAISCRRPAPTGAVRIDPALATLVPADTTVLVGTRLDKLRDTPLYRTRFENVPMPQLDRFAADTGLDPRKDVWEVLFCSNGKDSGLLMLRGKFAPKDLEPKLEREGAVRTNYKGYNLFGDARRSMFFMNSSTALAGSTPAIKSVIDRLNTAGGGIPPLLAPLVNEIPYSSQFWAVFDGVPVAMPFDENSNLGNINTMIRSLDNGYVAADLSKGLDLKAVGNCRSDEGAKQIHDALRGIIGIGRLSTPDNQPELLKAFDGIKVNQQSRTVAVAVLVTQDLVDRVLDMFTSSRTGSRPPGSSNPRPR